MPYAVYIFKTNGEVIATTQAKAPSLEQMQSAVGGYIETVPYFNAYCNLKRGYCYADEEGLLKRKPVNTKATELWRQNAERYGLTLTQNLVGDVIFYAKVKEDKV